MTTSQEEARAALRLRQGAGARYDAPAAPAPELDRARRGAAYFARMLGNLSDAELDAPSARPGLSRRHLVAFAALQARLLAETVAWMRAGRPGTLPFPLELLPDEVALAATLPAQALRHLVHHATVHLDVEWRDAVNEDWEKQAQDDRGRTVTLRETPQARAVTLWRLAIDLHAGGRPVDAPPELRDILNDRAIFGWPEG